MVCVHHIIHVGYERIKHERVELALNSCRVLFFLGPSSHLVKFTYTPRTTNRQAIVDTQHLHMLQILNVHIQKNSQCHANLVY